MKFKSIHTSEQLTDVFLLEDLDISLSEVYTQKLLTLVFDGPDSLSQLETYHTTFTETTPYQYYGVTFSIAKNYHTLKKYTVKGEEDLDGPKIKLLKFFLQDGSFIFVRSNPETLKFQILISVNGETNQDLQKKTAEIEKTLLDFIETIST